jgi:hypothetical protein
VIAIFRGLGLPVCDDGDAIRQKVQAQRPRNLKDKASPDPDARAKADQWFKDAEALENRRPELLRAMEELFFDMADSAISAAIAAGLSQLTPPLQESLLDLARDQCRTDEELARRFLDSYVKATGLETGILVKPAAVERFVAVSGIGEITLTWTLSADPCDEVEVVRSVESRGPEGKAGESRRVFPRNQTSFVDTGLSPGAWYRYRAVSIYQRFRREGPEARAVCLGEVRSAAAVWNDGRMTLRWEPPGVSTVVIFRRCDQAPAVRPLPLGPEPADAATAQVYRGGGGTSWVDPDVAEGITYHYRIVAEFGPGLFARGVDVQAKVPEPPPAVGPVAASHTRRGERDAVLVEWQPVPGNLPVEHLVVRREGSAPAGRVEDGALVRVTAQHRYLDEGVTPGRRYTYVVFTQLGGLLSRAGIAAAPVDILSEVTGLEAATGNGTVELSWTAPENVSSVVVRRSLSAPRDAADGTLVRLAGPGHAHDEGLRNGQRYHYLVSCGYRPEGREEVFSPGIRIAAVPDALPEPAQGFAVQARGAEVVCTWTPPDHGQVVVLRSAQPHGRRINDRLSAAEVDRLGERIGAAEEARAIDPKPDVRTPYYSAFTLAGSHAVTGGTGSCVVCPDVADLRVSVVREGVLLRWLWPEGVRQVRVARRTDDWPAGPDDPQARIIHCSLSEYLGAGGKLLDAIAEGSARLHYVLYARPSGAPGLFFAPGAADGCRAVVQWEPWMTLRYRLEPAQRGAGNGARMRLAWTVERPLPGFSGFALVASTTRIPAVPEDGIELFRWAPADGAAAGDHEAWVDLEPVRRRRWARFFCKAVVLDPAQRHAALLVHRDVSVPFFENGELPPRPRDRGLRRYRAGVPRTVICPSCFEEFPVGRMLFTSFNGDDPLPARYGWLDRLRRQPPQPPTNAQGQRLTRKLCPNRHALPFTAGAQGSLVIGLIGAKFSGKSHYIAALVKRLEEQVGSDLRAALLPVTEETQERYRRELYEPLFGQGLQLPVTVGTPPPLVYDLTLDGGLWGESRPRAITLALYDTAGESLDDQETVERMLRYLRIASGVIFLIDPLQVPAVRDALPSHLHPPQDGVADPNAILSRVLQVLEDGRVVAQAGSLSTPVAVALTKCDVLRDAGLIEENRLWSTDARHIGYFDREAHADMTGMMAERVQAWSPAAYHTVTRRFTRHAFFGVSATGCAPDPVTRRFRHISPWRVEDPLLWLLAELGVLPVR